MLQFTIIEISVTRILEVRASTMLVLLMVGNYNVVWKVSFQSHYSYMKFYKYLLV
jgi:hypothetical protein